MFQSIVFFIGTFYVFAVLSLPIAAEAARLPAVYRSEQRGDPCDIPPKRIQSENYESY